MAKADIYTTWSHAFCLVEAGTLKGQRWLRERCDCPLMVEHQMPVERRYIADLVYGAVKEGLTVEDTTTGRRAVA